MPKFILSSLFSFLCFLIYSPMDAQSNNASIQYTNCKDCWNADSLGNHRVVVKVNENAALVKVMIPWRRRDADPQNKRIIIQDAQSQTLVSQFSVIQSNREMGEINFKPISGKGVYYIYYMPYKNEGRSNYPKGVYLKPIQDNSLTNAGSLNLPIAQVTEFQSIDSLNSFYPMEVIATALETKNIIENAKGKPFIVFPEKREFPIVMTTDLPQRWITQASHQAEGVADKGEWFAFQLGLYAIQATHNVKVKFSNLKSENGSIIDAKKMTCINLEGTGYDAVPIQKTVNVSSGQVQALWCGVDVPTDAAPGIYTGTIEVSSNESGSSIIKFSLKVNNHTIVNSGADAPWNQTRLKWLNSTLAQQNEVIAPYTPLVVKGMEISLLGRKVILNKDGLPSQIQSFFTPEMTSYSATPKNILSQPMQFTVNGAPMLQSNARKQFSFTQQQKGTVQWTATTSSDQLEMQVKGSLEFDGFMVYTVKMTALQNLDVTDIQLQMPFDKKSATYMMGLGQKGGYRPASFNWKWEVATKNQDGAWIGDVNAGLQFSLRDENYVRPLNTNFYLQKPLLLPSSWGNQNKGGITISESGNQVLVNNFSGARQLKKGESLYYNFTILITPFHTLNTDFQWDAKFFHSYKPIDTIKAISSASIINIHHANEINPWINYPFIEHAKMKSYIDEAHSKGLKVKIYNTVRELSNHAYETFPMRSLGHEIYSTGKGGGYSWLQEHVGDDYIAAWFVPNIKDAAIVNSGMSRWHNYYIEGMNWLVKKIGIDGIYLDDVAFDRITMKRVKRVLTQQNHPGIIDLHSANQFNKNDGFNNSANLYMEHFPYINKLWFGEYFDYQKASPDFYLTEVSGIPFGLMGEMLQDGGNPYRGLIYGMTNRMPWDGMADPRAIWKLWDDFGIKGSKMIGYWSPNCPVATNNPKVLTTVYQKKKSVMIAVASWSDKTEQVNILIDWKKLGLDPSQVTVDFPAINHLQTKGSSNIVNNQILNMVVEPTKGGVIIIKEK